MSTNNLLIQLIKVLICLVFVTPLIVTNGTIYPSTVGKALYSNILIEIIFGLWLILILYNKEYRPKSSLIYLSLLVYLLVIIVTSLFGVDFAHSFWSNYSSMQGIFAFIHWIGLILVIISVCKTWQDYRNIIVVNACVSVVVCLGMLLHYDGLVFFSNYDPDNRTRFTYSTVMGNTSYLAQYCVTIIFLVLHVAIKHYSMFGRILSFVNIFSAIVIILNIATLWYASSRAAYLSVLIFILVFGAIYLFINNTKTIKYISYVSLSAVLFLVVFALFVLMSDFKFNVISENTSKRINAPLQKFRQTSSDFTISGRVIALKIGIKSFYDNPLHGLGNENYIVAWGKYNSRYTQESLHYPHNKLVEVLSSNGIFGFIAYCTVWILLAISIVSAFRQTQKYEQMSILILGGAILCFFINILFLFDTTTGMMQIALLTSMFIYYEHKYNTFAKIKQKLTVPDKYIMRIDFSSAKFITSMCVVILVVLIVFMIPIKQYNATKYLNASKYMPNINTQYYFYKKAVASFIYTEPMHMVMLSNIDKYLINYYMNNIDNKASLYDASIILEDIGNNESYNFQFYILMSYVYVYLSIFDDSHFDMAKYYYERASEMAPTYPRTRVLNDFMLEVEYMIDNR